jgi:NAD(P)-dependent dehydrogenase (short-subunit alcohol dehydrogenase family)
MLAQGSGAIVNIASVPGLVSAPPDLWRFANYSASKGGVIALRA